MTSLPINPAAAVESADPKPGWQSTEFLAMLAAQLVAILVTCGWVTLADAESLKTNATALVTSGGAFINAALSLWKYIQSRTEVKVAQAQAQAHVAVTMIEAGTPTLPPAQ